MSNPRNKTNTAEATETKHEGTLDTSNWNFMTVGSLSLRDGKNLVRDHDLSFVINSRNATVLRDAAQFVLDNPTDAEGKEQRISVNGSPFYEDKTSESVLKYFSHRLYISKATLSKMGKDFVDYLKS
jgi:hypothetical protein